MKIYRDIEQGTYEWLELKKGKLSGTSLGKALGISIKRSNAKDTTMYGLLAEKYLDLTSEVGLSAIGKMERGVELEPIAKAKYEQVSGYKVEEVGFIERDEEWIGCSPDGIILDEDSGLYKRALEIKCPLGQTFMKYLLNPGIPSEYQAQILNYFLVMEDLEELDFVFFHDGANTEIGQLHTFTITRGDLQKELDKAEEKLIAFRDKWVQTDKQLFNKKS